MRLAIMQPYLFPYLGYYQLLHAADRFLAYDDVAFIRQGWIHRNRLLINGRASLFTVPVRDRSSFRLIRDVEVEGGPDGAWRRKLLKTVDHAYRRAPYFGDVFPLVERVLRAPVLRVAELAMASLVAVARHLGLDTDIVSSSSVYQNRDLRGQARVIAICRAEGASEYVNASGGRPLYSTEAFDRAGIRLRFLEPRLPRYRQFGAPFVDALSIIDVLMFNSRETVSGYLAHYDLA